LCPKKRRSGSRCRGCRSLSALEPASEILPQPGSTRLREHGSDRSERRSAQISNGTHRVLPAEIQIPYDGLATKVTFAMEKDHANLPRSPGCRSTFASRDAYWQWFSCISRNWGFYFAETHSENRANMESVKTIFKQESTARHSRNHRANCIGCRRGKAAFPREESFAKNARSSTSAIQDHSAESRNQSDW